MAKVGFSPLGFGAGAKGMAAGSGIAIGVTAGATFGWAGGSGMARGAAS